MAFVSKKKKNTTLDDLAGMVQRGFLSVDRKFEDSKIETKKQIRESEERIKREIEGLELKMSS